MGPLCMRSQSGPYRPQEGENDLRECEKILRVVFQTSNLPDKIVFLIM